MMKNDMQFIFDPDKNRVLKEQRGVNFEDVIIAIEEGRVLEVRQHHNLTNYANQKLAVVEINSYAYLVPFIQQDNKIVLKTVYPSRKATALYLKNSKVSKNDH